MSVFDRTAPLRLFIGDIICFLLGLYFMLSIRYVASPSKQQFIDHLIPFLLVFLASTIVFYIAGLYDYHTTIFKRRVGGAIISAQLWSALIAVALFYFVPFFGIAPKVSLFLYVVISSVLVLGWRLLIEHFFVRSHAYKVVLLGRGNELVELATELHIHQASQFDIHTTIDMDAFSAEELTEKIKSLPSDIRFVIIDFTHPLTNKILPDLYRCLFKDIAIIDITDLFEDIFQRINLSSMSYEWLLAHVSQPVRPLYSFFKRSLDITASGAGLIFSALLFPFVWLAIKLDDNGPTFIFQERLGRHKKIINIPKFRSMHTSDKGVWVKEGDDRITRVGKILRKSRIDELPQLWSVFKGDMSLIGPRPDILQLGNQLSEQIDYYDTRYVVQPGLSGWAQITQELPPQSLEETKMRLAYDVYYVKHRSFFLDLAISLKTVRTLLSRTGK